MAAPEKPDHEKRRHLVKFYLTDEELRQAQGEVKTLGLRSVHEYGRVCLTGGRVKIVNIEGFPFEAVFQLKKLGNVIWQCLRHARQTGQPLPGLQHIADQLNQILNSAFETALNDRPGSHGKEL